MHFPNQGSWASGSRNRNGTNWKAVHRAMTSEPVVVATLRPVTGCAGHNPRYAARRLNATSVGRTTRMAAKWHQDGIGIASVRASPSVWPSALGSEWRWTISGWEWRWVSHSEWLSAHPCLNAPLVTRRRRQMMTPTEGCSRHAPPALRVRLKAVAIGAIGGRTAGKWHYVSVSIAIGLIIGAAYAEAHMADYEMGIIESLSTGIANEAWGFLVPGILAAFAGAGLAHVGVIRKNGNKESNSQQGVERPPYLKGLWQDYCDNRGSWGECAAECLEAAGKHCQAGNRGVR